MCIRDRSETVTATALPTIVGDLGGVDHMQWVTTAYILASTIMMPIYGKLGDLFGRKYLFIVALSVFIVGSATCGLAPSMDGLIAGRAVEGLGGGGLIILAQATIADIIPPRQRGKYMGVMGSVFAVSTVVGPLLGGWFVQVTGWRWLFAFNIPLALLAIAAVAFFLTNPERRDDRPPVDVGGMMAMAVSVSSLVQMCIRDRHYSTASRRPPLIPAGASAKSSSDRGAACVAGRQRRRSARWPATAPSCIKLRRPCLPCLLYTSRGGRLRSKNTAVRARSVSSEPSARPISRALPASASGIPAMPAVPSRNLASSSVPAISPAPVVPLFDLPRSRALPSRLAMHVAPLLLVVQDVHEALEMCIRDR